MKSLEILDKAYGHIGQELRDVIKFSGAKTYQDIVDHSLGLYASHLDDALTEIRVAMSYLKDSQIGIGAKKTLRDYIK